MGLTFESPAKSLAFIRLFLPHLPYCTLHCVCGIKELDD